MSVSTGGLTKGLGTASKGLQGFTGTVGVSTKALAALAIQAAAIIGPFLAFQGILSGVSDAMSDISSSDRLASRLGASTESLSGLQYAAKSAGIDVEAFNDGLSDMVEKLGDARMGGGEAREVLDALGLSVDELAAKDPTEAFTIIAHKISQLDNQADKLTLADKMFGGVGQEIIPLLDKGAEGIKELQARAEELGVSFNSIDAAKVAMANQAMTELQSVLTGVWRTLAIEVSPIITAVATKFTELGTEGWDVSDTIVTGMKWVSSGIGIAADILDVLYDGFLFLQSGVTKGIAIIVSNWAQLAKAIQYVVNKLPGVKVSFGDTLDAIGKDMNKLANKQWEEAKESFAKPPPSEGVSKFFADIESQSKKTGKAMRTNSVGASIVQNKAGLDLITSLRQQIEVMKLGEDQAKLNELRSQGVSEAIIEQVAALQGQKTALEASKQAAQDLASAQEKLKQDAESLTEKFASPVEKFKSEFERLRELLSKGLISKDTFKSAALDALPDKVKGIIEEMKTPMEKFQDEMKELTDLKAAGLLNSDQFQFAVDKLKKELGGDSPKAAENKLASAAEFGSQEARSSILKNRLGNRDPMKELQKTELANLEESRKQTTQLTKIASKGINIVTF